MKKLTTSVLAVVLSSSFAVVSAQTVKDTAKTTQIEEVVITGALGIKKTADATTSAQQIVGTKELNQAAAPSAIQSLTGKVSGLKITNTNSSVNPDYNIVLRGAKSVTGNNQALIVIDNSISTAAILGAIPPEAIESVNIIKGLQGSALYGSQGVNGVIIVTTKKGTKSEKITFNLTSAVEISQVFKLPKVQTRYGKGVQDESYSDEDYGGTNYVPWENTSWGPAYNGSLGGQMVPTGLPQADGNYIYGKYAPVKDHFSKFFQNGVNFQNGLSINVGGPDSYAFLSMNRLDNEFVVANDKLKQNNFLFKGGKKFNKLRIDGQFNYISRTVNQTNGGLYDDILQMPTTNDIRVYRNSGIPGYLTAYATNPYWTMQHERLNSTMEYLNGIVSLQYDFNKNINLSYTGNLSLSKTEQENHNDGFKDVVTYADANVPLPNGVASYFYNRNYTDRRYYGDLMLNFNYDLTDDLNLKVNLGNNIQDRAYNARSVGGSGLIIPGWYSVNNISSLALPTDTGTKEDGGTMENYNRRVKTYAFFGNLDLAYKDYLFLNATYRYEQSSLFTTNIGGNFNNKAYPYYSAGLSFIPTKAFDFGGDVLTYMKIAPSYSRVGNANLNPYQINPTGNVAAGYPFNVPSYILNTSVTNPNLKPEYFNSIELNAMFGFFNDRITLEGSVYQSKTKDLIIASAPSNSSGLSSYVDNIGNSKTKGFDIDLGLTPIKTQNFTWNLHAYFSKSETILESLRSGASQVSLLTYSSPSIGVAAVVGQNLYSFVGSTYQKDPNGNIIVGANGVPIINSALSVLGNVNPDYTMGLTTSFKYKGLSLSAVMDYRKGGQFVSFTKGLLAFTGGLEQTANQDRENGYVVPNSVQLINGQYVANTTAAYSADYSGAVTYWTGNNFRRTGENLIVDATFFKVREIALSYDLPKSLLASTFVNGVTFSLYARNPIAIYAKSNRNFADPETSNYTGNLSGIADTSQYPTTRVFGFKLNATF
ncbi:SusC/RagA family TonB-linked outer membrane protein [Epilithonimonas zeae]|uniref:TonB-linked outer membrane protein, SusC/RagA family n=1 Tax=Epilithonimonas zeae TaxID=1416779 RepID=A0A1N6DY72_9FLAO|nr:SusC/RagA family TonB-linked outer membrane protein [Epilithonimonas zeae]SIN75664.1 TonB-linked outer membrane protein, SusC/RagA family [Epilithonimonas zeae]